MNKMKIAAALLTAALIPLSIAAGEDNLALFSGKYKRLSVKMNDVVTKKKCRNCEGKGKIDNPNYNPKKLTFKTIRCPDCKGKKFLEKKENLPVLYMDNKVCNIPENIAVTYDDMERTAFVFPKKYDEFIGCYPAITLTTLANTMVFIVYNVQYFANGWIDLKNVHFRLSDDSDRIYRCQPKFVSDQKFSTRRDLSCMILIPREDIALFQKNTIEKIRVTFRDDSVVDLKVPEEFKQNSLFLFNLFVSQKANQGEAK